MLGHRPFDTEDYLGILKRRWWLIAIPAIVLPLLAFGVSFLVAPQYLSQTLVIIQSQKVPDNYVKPVITSDLDSRLASMKEQILSRSRLQPIIERYKLYPGDNLTMDDRIALARKSINIKPITSEVTHGGGLPGFFISFTARDPHVAQMVCGEITSLFLDENLRSREESAEGTTSFLASQLADAKRKLDEQDAKLAAFQRQYIGRLPSEETTNLDMLTTLNTQLESANQSLARMEQDRSYEEAMLAQQQQASAPAQVKAAAAASVTPQELQLQNLEAQEADLSAHYTDDYPDVIAVRRKIADLRKQMSKTPTRAQPAAGAAVAPSIPESASLQQLRAQIRSAGIGIQAKRAEQANIQSSIRTYQSRIQSTPLVEEQYKEITRDNQTAQAFYDDLLNKMNQSKMATDLEKREGGEQFEVMDEPNLPDSPVFPKRGLFAAGGFIGGIALGLIIVAGLEYRDQTVRSEKDIWYFTKLPTLAHISDLETDPFTSSSSPGFWSRLFRRKPQLASQVRG